MVSWTIPSEELSATLNTLNTDMLLSQVSRSGVKLALEGLSNIAYRDH